ncbi:MAG: DNA primase family protein, partial [Ktedonobacterales bacterium]
ILPGSTSYKGTYTWEREPGAVAWAPLPAQLAYKLSANNRRNQAEIREKTKGGAPIPEGMRDQAMYQLIADLWDSGVEAEQLLELALAINRDRCKPPLRDAVIREKVRRRIEKPRQPQQRASAEDLAKYKEPSFLSEDMRWTTSGNARRLAVNFADRICFVAQLGWNYYLTGRWRSDISDLVVSRLVKDTIALSSAWAALPEQIEQLETEQRRAWWRNGWHENTRYASNHVSDIVRNARSEPELAARAEDFDCDPWLLNTPEAVLDLKHRGRRIAHSPHLRHAKQTSAHYNPTTTCPTWLTFLNSTFQSDQQLIAYLQMMLGYLLTGDTNEQVWFLFVGRKGRNGKGTLVETIRAVLGDYALPLDINVLLQKAQAQDGNAPKPALAALVNARLATSQEPDGGFKDSARWNASMLKDLTGQDVLQVRDLYGKSFSFLPMVKLIVSVNMVPETKEHTAAVWDRIIPIPFNRYFAPDERITNLRETLKAEASGILNWMLEGLDGLLQVRAKGKSLSDED